MPEGGPGSAPLHLAAEFPPAAREEWEAVIATDLAGADYQKKLVWKSEDGIAVQPYYRREDVAPLDVSPGQFPFVRGNGQPWQPAGLDTIASNAIRADWFAEAGATTVQEIAWALAAAVDQVANSQGTRAVDFVFSVGPDFFFELAKFRAIRLVWAQAATALQAEPRTTVHALTALYDKSIYDPYTNLLRATTEALAAATGGADRITVRAAGFDEHLASGIQHILSEEAHIDRVADPGGGSYYIEKLTLELAQAAWKEFQAIEAEGGWSKVVGAGKIDAELKARCATKLQMVASRRRTLVGVNSYPDLAESALDRTPLPAPAKAPFSPLRLAGEFEQIRLATDRHAARTGKRPIVLLLTRGDLSMRMARANFCANFFGCAGFSSIESHELQPADLIVLCSSDGEYVSLAREICPAAGAPVVVAGNPKAHIEELTQVGVAGFVHVLSNAVDTLREWQRRLGIEE
jgi:methylmalonyl-CoA mutase